MANSVEGCLEIISRAVMKSLELSIALNVFIGLLFIFRYANIDIIFLICK